MLEPAGSKFYAADIDEVSEQLTADLKTGLAADEVQHRLAQYGRNEFDAGNETRWWQVLGRQFQDVLILILFIAALISIAVGEITDAVTILGIILINGSLGFFQEWKPERALQALQQMLSPQCLVLPRPSRAANQCGCIGAR